MRHVLAIAGLMLLIQGCIRMHDVRASSVALGTVETGPEDRFEANEGPAPAPRPRERVRYRIDLAFIQAVEGRPQLRGYVPTARRSGRVLGRSGVTVGTGFDLGQHDLDDLRRMGVTPGLARSLTPYLKRRGQAAQSLLSERPLTLTAAEAAELDHAKRLDTARKIARRFDADRGQGVPVFADLSPAQQTVIFSLATQYGPRLDRKTPTFWDHVIHGRFGSAHGELRNFGDGYPTRRNSEADLLLRERHTVSSGPR